MPPLLLTTFAARVFLVLCLALGAPMDVAAACLHFAPNGNFYSDGAYLPGKVGFNLADVNSVAEILDTLPAGVKGLSGSGNAAGSMSPSSMRCGRMSATRACSASTDR